MSHTPNERPLVDIITPVYNGGPYIAECIESVLRQTYDNWTFTISDNRSTDDTVSIASRYAEKDPRIRVRTHAEHLGQMDNWNRALSYLEPEAAYFKMLHADDWMYPSCLDEMVAVAMGHPSVGIVSAYRLEELYPSLGGIPSGKTVTPGAQICRQSLLHEVAVFGSPSNILLRADLVRKHRPFYDSSFIHADYESCLRLLEESDLGFVFKVLTFTRRHNESYTSRNRRYNTYPSEDLWIFQQYGRRHFSRDEFERMMRLRIAVHYRFLGKSVFQRKGRDFWKYQRDSLAKIGLRISYGRVAAAALFWLLDVPEVVRHFRGRSQAV